MKKIPVLSPMKIVFSMVVYVLFFSAVVMAQGLQPDSGGFGAFQGGLQPNLDFPICTVYGAQTMPESDYCRGPDFFLVAWKDSRASASPYSDVYARIATKGISTPHKEFKVNENTMMHCDCQQIGVGANQYAGEFLVCWGTENGEVIGQFVDDTGRVGGEMVLMTGLNQSTSIDVEYCSLFGLNAHYLVVVGGSAGLFGIIVSPAGVVTASYTLSTYGGSFPQIAYNYEANQSLVIWRRPLSGGFDGDIYGRRIDNFGAPMGAEFAISTGYYDQWLPSVTYNAQQDCYLAVWEDLRNIYTSYTAEVWGQLIDENGTLIGGNVALIVPGSYEMLRAPDVAANNNGSYLLTWTFQPVSLAYELRGVQLDSSLKAKSKEFKIPASLNGYSSWGTVVFNPLESYYLCAWCDTRNGDTDIYGKYMKGVF